VAELKQVEVPGRLLLVWDQLGEEQPLLVFPSHAPLFYLIKLSGERAVGWMNGGCLVDMRHDLQNNKYRAQKEHAQEAAASNIPGFRVQHIQTIKVIVL
jgi:hypothetical protein